MSNISIKDKDLSQYAKSIPQHSTNLRKSVGMEKKVGEFYFLNVNTLLPYKSQARKVFNNDDIEGLAATIRAHGIRQPLAVYPSALEQGKFEVVSGERRLRAAIVVGLEYVPCIIMKDPENIDEIALIENVQRVDLHPVEFADAIANIINTQKRGEISSLAIKLGKPLSTISEALAVSKLPDEIKEALIQHDIRSRDQIRRLLNMDLDSMKSAVGIMPKKQESKPVSILRISKVGKDFKIQDRAINKMSADDKAALKVELERLLTKL